MLESFAELGAPLSSIIDIESEYRFLVKGKYLIFYRAYESAVFIDRILYSGRDYLRVLFPEEQSS